jgi:hypothetical protein
MEEEVGKLWMKRSSKEKERYDVQKQQQKNRREEKKQNIRFQKNTVFTLSGGTEKDNPAAAKSCAEYPISRDIVLISLMSVLEV